jgi:hypothetical protein
MDHQVEDLVHLGFEDVLVGGHESGTSCRDDGQWERR